MMSKTMPVSHQAINVGIDTAKRNLDVHILQNDWKCRIPNCPDGIERLVEELRAVGPPDAMLVVIEASGGYERDVHTHLAEAGFPIALVNAKRVRDFARATGLLAKTDQIDARVLADYGRACQPRPTPPKEASRAELAEMLAYRSKILDEIAQRRQQLATMKSDWVRSKAQAHLTILVEERKAVTAEIAKTIKNDQTLATQAEIIQSFKGAGPILAATLLAHLPELGQLSDKEIASLTGLAPFNRDSGTLRGKRMIQGGRAAIRHVLYVCALSAIKYNPSIKPFYERLAAKGKPGKVAVVAAMRKMIVILNAMARDNATWKNPETSP